MDSKLISINPTSNTSKESYSNRNSTALSEKVTKSKFSQWNHRKGTHEQIAAIKRALLQNHFHFTQNFYNSLSFGSASDGYHNIQRPPKRDFGHYSLRFDHSDDNKWSGGCLLPYLLVSVKVQISQLLINNFKAAEGPRG